MQDLMTRTDIKERAQLNLLNDGSGAFIFSWENNIEPLELDVRQGIAIDENELTNEKAIYAEMEIQFDRMVKFLGFSSFQGSH